MRTLLLELRVDHHRPAADRQIREPPVISAFPPRRLPTPRPGHRAAASQATTRTNFPSASACWHLRQQLSNKHDHQNLHISNNDAATVPVGPTATPQSFNSQATSH